MWWAGRVHVLSVLRHGLLLTQLTNESCRAVFMLQHSTSISLLLLHHSKGYLSIVALLIVVRVRDTWMRTFLHRELQLLIFLHHLFQVRLTLNCLSQLKIFVSQLFLFLLDNPGEVGAEIFISLHTAWPAPNDLLHLSLELLNHLVLA